MCGECTPNKGMMCFEAVSEPALRLDQHDSSAALRACSHRQQFRGIVRNERRFLVLGQSEC